MKLLSPEVTTSALAVLSIIAELLATWLSRQGKREDNRLAERSKAFDELKQLSETRLVEINRLTTERDAANLEKDKVRKAADERWDRQMARCREITEALVDTITTLQGVGDPQVGQRAAEEALRSLAEHNERDHSSEG